MVVLLFSCDSKNGGLGERIPSLPVIILAWVSTGGTNPGSTNIGYFQVSANSTEDGASITSVTISPGDDTPDFSVASPYESKQVSFTYPNETETYTATATAVDRLFFITAEATAQTVVNVIGDGTPPPPPSHTYYEVNAGVTRDPAGTLYAPVSVSLDASGSVEVEDSHVHGASAITTFDWDLDGDGTFEVSGAGSTDIQTVTCTGVQAYSASVKVHSDAVNPDGHPSNPEDEASINWSVGQPITLSTAKTPSDVDGDDPLSVDFTATNLNSLAVTNLVWDFTGDGTDTEAIANPTATDFQRTKNYAYVVVDPVVDPTVYTPSVTVTYEGFTETYDATQTVSVNSVVGEIYLDPVAVLTATPDTGNKPLLVTLDASGSSDQDDLPPGEDGIIYYDWDLDGDGTFETPGGNNPTREVTLTSSGLHTFGVQVTDNDGPDFEGTATGTATVTVIEVPPTAVLTATTIPAGSGSDPIIVHGITAVASFNASGSNDIDGFIDNYLWDFDGNGVFDEIPEEQAARGDNSPSFTYNGYGTYAASVQVVDDDGLTATASITIILNQPPVPIPFVDPERGTPPLPVEFSAGDSYDNDGTIVTWEWDFLGDGTFVESSSTAQNTYTVAGIYYPVCRVTDNHGGQATAPTEPVVVSTPPTAVFTANGLDVPISGTYDIDAAFDARGSFDVDAPQGDSIDNYEWDFDGDGVFSELGLEADAEGNNTPDFTYLQDPWVNWCETNGPIQVGLRVTDTFGETGTVTFPITVLGWPPMAAFDITLDPLNPDQDAPFLVTTDGDASVDDPAEPGASGITGLLWDWGYENNTSTGTDKSLLYDHTYVYPTLLGELNTIDQWKRTIYLTVTDRDGLTDQEPGVGAPQGDIDAKTIIVRGWRRAIIDNGGGMGSVDVGRWTSVIQVDGFPAVCYYDAGNQNLVFIRANIAVPVTANDWGSPIIVDDGDYDDDGIDNRNVGQYCTMAQIGFDDSPAIAYYDATERNVMYIRALSTDGSSWPTDPLCLDNIDVDWADGNVEGYISLAECFNNPAICFIEDIEENNGGVDEKENKVRFIRADDTTGLSWPAASIEVVSGSDLYEFCSLANVDGNPGILYRDVDNIEVRFARASDASGTSGGWTGGTDVLVATTGGVVRDCQLTIIGSNPACVYAHEIDEDHKNIVYQYCSTADGGTDASWTDSGSVNLILSDNGRFPYLAQSDGVTPDDVPWISYYEYTNAPVDGRLIALRADDLTGSAWTIPQKLADPTIDAGQYSSMIFLTVNNDGTDVWRPAIVYYDETSGELKYCIYN